MERSFPATTNKLTLAPAQTLPAQLNARHFGGFEDWRLPTIKELYYVDVHGAGAHRSDPKSGNAAMFPHGRGPQGDVIRITNFVRLVRDESTRW